MTKSLQFKISSALKDIIGRDLITDDFVAVFELVKNSFDAYATRVDIYFENLYSNDSRIIIKDNGKGMNYEDITNRWLFLAYSAKKDGSEDENFDYRDSINVHRHFAGAKGIGRFSCDRLGKKLMLESTKNEKNPITQVLKTDWEKFEIDLKDEFININVAYNSKNKSDYGLSHGTVIEISELRSDWDRYKLIKLKDSLTKLITPSISKSDQTFKIFINAPEELGNDKNSNNERSIVNGEVKNFIFEDLGLKTSKLTANISKDGKILTTELKDGGTLIYKIKETSNYSLLYDINFTLYYLNQSAKLTFARRMGLSSRAYGHVFVYKNGFRIFPFGEPYEDPMKIDVRKSRKIYSHLGTGELIGLIEIFGENKEFKETSSRGDGLIKNSSYFQLEECFFKILERLEKYVVDVQKWGLSIEDDSSLDFKSRVADLIAKLSNSNELIEFKVPENFLDILKAGQKNSIEIVVKNLNKIALESGNEILIAQASIAAKKLNEIQLARKEAEKQAEAELKRAEEATKKLKEQISENLFLKSINTSEFQEVISLLHHIGIYAGTIDNNLKGISLRIQNNIPLTNKELNDIIKTISFETKKILNVAAFATKANFKLTTEDINVDLRNYIREYIQNIIPSITDKDLKIEVIQYTSKEYLKKVKPIELNIVIDNIISNAKKAKANILKIEFHDNENHLEVRFIDNGTGISLDIIDRIYDFGFTTTDGSGLGLFHVKKIIDELNGTIISKNNDKFNGATFTLIF